MRREKLLFLPLVLPLLLLACTVGPNYGKPDIATSDAFPATNGIDAPLSLPVADETDLSHWWNQFHDTELTSLISRALDANLDLLSAASRVREAREHEIISGASDLPTISALGNAAQLHTGTNILSSLGSGGSSSSGSGGSRGAAPTSGGTDIQLYSLGFDASWEIDVFGGVRRSVEAARAGTEAARWQMRDGEVTLTAEIASDYFDLRATQTRLVLLKDQLNRQQQTLDLVTARREAGFITELDVNQQKASAAGTAAQIPTLEAEARTLEHSIAVLLAVQPEALNTELDKTAPIPEIPATLPIGLPSDLLRRRPDVQEAERKLAQATAEKGVAIAALYPKFDLLGGLMLASNGLGSLFNSSSLGELGLASITWPIFSGGQAHANIRAKEEDRIQAYYAYQKAVLAAVQDSENALARYTGEQRRYIALQQIAMRDHSSSTIARQQYQAGLTNFVNVLTAESTDLQAQDQLAQSSQTLASDLVSLYKALGGGWANDQ